MLTFHGKHQGGEARWQKTCVLGRCVLELGANYKRAKQFYSLHPYPKGRQRFEVEWLRRNRKRGQETTTVGSSQKPTCQWSSRLRDHSRTCGLWRQTRSPDRAPLQHVGCHTLLYQSASSSLASRGGLFPRLSRALLLLGSSTWRPLSPTELSASCSGPSHLFSAVSLLQNENLRANPEWTPLCNPTRT